MSLSSFILLYHDNDSIFMDGRHDVHSTYPLQVYSSWGAVRTDRERANISMLCFLALSLLRAHTPFSSPIQFLPIIPPSLRHTHTIPPSGRGNPKKRVPTHIHQILLFSHLPPSPPSLLSLPLPSLPLPPLNVLQNHILQPLGVRARNRIHALPILPEMKSRDGTHPLPLEQLPCLRSGVTDDLDKDGVKPVGHLVEFGGHHLAGAAPGGGVVDDQQLLAGAGDQL